MDLRNEAIRRDPLALDRSLTLEEISPAHQLSVRTKAMALKCDIRNLKHLDNSIKFLTAKKVEGRIPRNMLLELRIPSLGDIRLSTKFMSEHNAIAAKTEAKCTELWQKELGNIYKTKKAEVKAHKSEILRKIKAEEGSDETKAPMLEVIRALKIAEPAKPQDKTEERKPLPKRQRTF